MAPTEVRITLRLTPKLHEELVAASYSSGKSINAEIVSRLDQSFVAAKLPDGATLEEMLENQIRQARAALEFLSATEEKK